MNIFQRIARLIRRKTGPRVTINTRAMTPDEKKHFDEAFSDMKESFAKLDKAIKVLRNVR